MNCEGRPPSVECLEFAAAPDGPSQAIIDELKTLARLDFGRGHFRATRRLEGRTPEKGTIRMHPSVELMRLLSRAVQVPSREPAAATVQV